MKLIRTCSRQVLALCAIALGSSLAMPTVRDGRAADISWIAGSGDWNTAANWSGGVVPTVADDVTIDQPGDLQITISAAAIVNSVHSQEAIVLLRGQSGQGRLTLGADSAMEGGLTLSDSSTLIVGAGNLSIDGDFTWQGGFMTGPGRTVLATTSTTTLSGMQNPALFSRDFDNAGTINYFPQSTYGLELSSTIPTLGSTLRNLESGTFNLFSDATSTTVIKLGASPSLIENAGTFNKYGAGDFISQVPLNNSGTINLFTGKLVLTVESANTGTINVPAAAGLKVASYTNAGTINVHENVSPSGPSVFTAELLINEATGHLNLVSGYSNLNGTINQSGEINVASGASMTLNGVLNSAAGSKITGPGHIVFNTPVDNFAGTLSATGDVMIAKPFAFAANQTIAAHLSLTGDLAGSGNVLITGSLTWTEGAMSGSGKTTIAPGNSATIAPAASASQIAPTLSRIFENSGTTNLLEADAQGVTLNFSGGSIDNVTGGIVNISTYQSAGKFSGTGALNNAGTLNVASTSSGFDFGGVTLNNMGTANVYSAGLKATTNNSGALNVYSSALTASGVNAGTIDFFNSRSNLDVALLTNSGILKASFGTLNVVNARGIGGEINAAAGTIVSVNGSAGAAQNATAKITGAGNVTLTNFTQYAFAGSLQSTGDILLSNTVNIDKDQIIAGRLVIPGGASGGTLGGSGNIMVVGSIGLDNNAVLGGSGKLIIAEHAQAVAAGVIQTTKSIENYGTFDVGSPVADFRLTNSSFVNGATGKLTVEGSGHWWNVQPNTTSSFTNFGLLQVGNPSATGVVSMQGVSFANSGTIQVDGMNSSIQLFFNNGATQYHDAGTILLNGGTISVSSSFNNSVFSIDGSVAGRGNVTVGNTATTKIVSHGLIAPGLLPLGTSGPDSLQFTSLQLANDAITSFTIAGATPAIGYGYIKVAPSTAVLGGTLAVRFANGFESSILPAQKFDIIQGPPMTSGSFLNVANGERLLTADGFGSFIVHYGPGTTLVPGHVMLSDYLPYVPGDFNADGQVDASDFMAWQSHFPLSAGASLAMGDADGDGDVDGADFVAWQTGGSTATSNVTVPEPKAGCLALMMLAGLLAMRRCF